MPNTDILFKSTTNCSIDTIIEPLMEYQGVELAILREDLINAEISGNKFRKLKYNLLEAEKQQKDTLLTYGGAFSNHIAATAKAGALCGFKTIGIIRGEELGADLNKTLKQNKTLGFAYNCGMHFKFVTRTAYRDKAFSYFKEELKADYGEFYDIPEGGTNHLAVKGCEEILNATTARFDYIASAVGTGGTIAGIINGSLPHQKVIGFPALKGDFLDNEIKKYTQKQNWELTKDYNFGGYAKFNSELISFINNFKVNHKIQLDPIYTGKMMYGLIDLISNSYFSKNTRILAVHTGGLQGIAGINNRLQKAGKPTIK